MIPFPTRPQRKHHGITGAIPGHPQRARHCECGSQYMPDDDGGCCNCGYYTAEIIEETWQQRTRRLGRAVA